MKCGDTIFVRDLNGSNARRFIAQCGGRFMLISHIAGDYRNGFILSGWPGVLRELIVQTVPASLAERAFTIESTANGKYVNFPLTYPLSIMSLAEALGIEAADVRTMLKDLAVSAD